jgi:import inner membrane translocase subunit TIM21
MGLWESLASEMGVTKFRSRFATDTMSVVWFPLPPTRCMGHLWRLSQSSAPFSAVQCRRYATHRGTGAPAFSHPLDTQQTGPSIPVRDTVGPFQLGISQDSLRRGEKVKNWSELSARGKGSCKMFQQHELAN